MFAKVTSISGNLRCWSRSALFIRPLNGSRLLIGNCSSLSSSPSASKILDDDNLLKPSKKTNIGPTALGPRDLTFDNGQEAFRSKSNWEVLRAYLVFTLCSSTYLVENNMKVKKGLFIVSVPSKDFLLNRIKVDEISGKSARKTALWNPDEGHYLRSFCGRGERAGHNANHPADAILWRQRYSQLFCRRRFGSVRTFPLRNRCHYSF